MINSEYKVLIERYLDGEMNYQEKLDFAKELEKNADLKSEFEFYKLANIAVKEYKLFSIQNDLQFVKEEYIVNEKKKLFYKILIPVIIGILGVALYAYLGTGSNEAKVEKTKSVQLADTVKKTSESISIESYHANSEKVDIVKRDRADVENIAKEAPLSIKGNEANIVQNIPIKVLVDSTQEKSSKLKDKFVETAKNVINPCVAYNISFGVSEKQTCFDKHSGEIIVNKCEGGIKPYTYILSNGEQNGSGVFNGLEAGEYSVYVKDNNGCNSEVKTSKIKTIQCNLDFYLDPSTNIPVRFQAYHIVGTLYIYDKGGNLKSKSTMPADSDFDWYGDAESVKLAAGYYLFIIKYEDGVVQNGSITILP